MENYRIAVPSSQPGGMQSALGAHFGHCDCYTVVEVEEGQVAQVSTLPNVAHVQGGCMAPVNYLSENGITVLLAGGMGMRPLMGFQQVGIQVYHGGEATSVQEAIEAFLHGHLQVFSQNNTCGGGLG